jgi:hypothetical protein
MSRLLQSVHKKIAFGFSKCPSERKCLSEQKNVRENEKCPADQEKQCVKREQATIFVSLLVIGWPRTTSTPGLKKNGSTDPFATFWTILVRAAKCFTHK